MLTRRGLTGGMRIFWLAAALLAGGAYGWAQEGAGGPRAAASVALELVWIPPGEFTMGSPVMEENRLSNEGPQTPVTLTRGFWMGKFEVTQGQWEELMRTSARKQRDKSNPRWQMAGEGREFPVYFVNYLEAVEFCRQLTERERPNLPAGYVYRLPTEAEWEYGARAGGTNLYPGGDQVDDLAWHRGNARKRTQPVGGKAPNAWGLHDMAGNVWEWCLDQYSRGLLGRPQVDPIGPDRGTARVCRGGSWENDPPLLRTAVRVGNTEDFRSFSVGFRVVLAPQI